MSRKVVRYYIGKLLLNRMFCKEVEFKKFAWSMSTWGMSCWV